MFEHLAGHGLRAHRVSAHPRVVSGEDREGRFDEVGLGSGPGDLVEAIHALVVVDPLGLQLREQGVARLVLLGQEHDHRVFEHGLDEAQHLQVVVRGVAVQGFDGFHDEQREGLVQPEVVLEVEVDPERVGLDDLGVEQ